MRTPSGMFVFFFNDTATTEIYTLSLHDALPISPRCAGCRCTPKPRRFWRTCWNTGRSSRTFSARSEEHTSELQSRLHLVCRLLLEKKKTTLQTRLRGTPNIHRVRHYTKHHIRRR